MTISTAQYLRRMLADPIKRTAQYVYGDGTATAFFLSGAPIFSGTAPAFRFALTGQGLSASGAATATGWDYENGIVALNSAMWPDSGAFVEYSWSVFSEEEIATLTGMAASLDAMALEGIKWLQADYSKRVKWSMAQGPSVDPTMAARHLEALYKQYRQALREDGAAAEGGFESWAEYSQGSSE